MTFSHLRIHRSTLVKLRMLATWQLESIAGLVDRLVEQELDKLDEAVASLIRENARRDRDDQ